MTWTEWAIVFFVIQIIHGLGTWKLYKKQDTTVGMHLYQFTMQLH